MKDTQVELEANFLASFSDLNWSLSRILDKLDSYITLLQEHKSTLQRIESKIDTISIQTIKESELL